MAYVICQPPCVVDRRCIQVCPVDCIHEVDGRMVVDPRECIDCDACAEVCQFGAISPAQEVPASWRAQIDINAALAARAEGRG